MVYQEKIKIQETGDKRVIFQENGSMNKCDCRNQPKVMLARVFLDALFS